MLVWVDRKEYDPTTTLSDIYVNGVFECVGLEDRVREGPKVPGETAIPEGKYEVRITWSPRFKRHLPLLIDVPGFDGIRIHPGNDHHATHGCLLVGENVTTVAGVPFLLHSVRAFDRLYAKLETAKNKKEPIYLEVLA
jgi:hypothetical protein